MDGMYFLLLLPVIFITWILYLVTKHFEFKIISKIFYVILALSVIAFVVLYLHYINFWIF